MRRLLLGPAWTSVIIPIVGLVLFATALFLVLVSDFARQQDRAFIENSERLVVNAVSERVRALENIAADFAVWNDAYAATRPAAWDQAWLDENYYSNVTDGLFILTDSALARYSWAADSEGGARLAEAVLQTAGDVDLSALAGSTPDAIAIITRHAIVNGAPALISFVQIAPEQSDRDWAAAPGRFLAIVDILYPEEITAIGDARDLRQLQFAPSDNPEQRVALPWSNNGAPLGFLTWARERPGSMAFSRQLPPILAGLFLIGALTLLLTRRLVNAQVSAQVQTQSAFETSRLKSEFIATMSHELRTPLNAIIGYTELIQEQAEAAGGDAKAIHDDAESVLDAARRLNRLVNNILDQSRIDAGRLHLVSESIEIHEILGELEELMTPLAQTSRNRFSLHADAKLGAVQADPVRLQQCLVNLTSNALKFTHAGQVSVNVSARDVGGVRMACFEIRDTGIGIAEKELERLFKPFAGAQSSDGGFATTGLSLSITRSLARAMHGDVEAHSTPGAGSTFTLMLPVAQASHRATA